MAEMTEDEYAQWREEKELDEDFSNEDENDEADSEPGICPTCNGSGEGAYEGSTCSACKGKGER